MTSIVVPLSPTVGFQEGQVREEEGNPREVNRRGERVHLRGVLGKVGKHRVEVDLPQQAKVDLRRQVRVDLLQAQAEVP